MSAWHAVRLIPVGGPSENGSRNGTAKGAGLTSARESRYVKRNGGRGADEEEGSFTREGRAEEEDAWSVEHLGTGRQRRWWWWWW